MASVLHDMVAGHSKIQERTVKALEAPVRRQRAGVIVAKDDVVHFFP